VLETKCDFKTKDSLSMKNITADILMLH